MLVVGRARISVKTQPPAPQAAAAALSVLGENPTLQFSPGLSLSKLFNFQGLCYLVCFGEGRTALEQSSWLLPGAAEEGRTIS